MADIDAYLYAGSNEAISLTQLTAASTGTEAIKLKHPDRLDEVYTNVLFAVTVAAITTNVEVYLQGSLDNLNWFNLDEDEGTIKYTSNGTYAIRYQGEGEVLFIRLYFYAESGGTAATIDSKAKIFGKPISTKAV